MCYVSLTVLTLFTARHAILPSGNLQISEVRESDQGVYECQAYNPVREQYRTSDQVVTLRIIGMSPLHCLILFLIISLRQYSYFDHFLMIIVSI